MFVFKMLSSYPSGFEVHVLLLYKSMTNIFELKSFY